MDCCKVIVEKSPAQIADSAICGACGNKARKVARITVEHILRSERRNEIGDTQYHFCAEPTCDVVYFSNETEQYFTKKDVRARVGIKETQDPITICYCFNHTLASAREEIARTGRSTAASSITAEIKAGRCACEVKNPSGRCCLGEVNKAVTALLKEQAIPVMERHDSEVSKAVSGINSIPECKICEV